MTPAELAYERMMALIDQIGVLGEQLEIVKQQWLAAKDAE